MRQEVKFQKKTLELIDSINEILKEYKEAGMTITTRGLFYQLVARNIIPNNLQSYEKLSRDSTKARYAGLVDWDIIIDNSNFLSICNFFDNVEDLIKAAKQSYRLDRWEGQDYYIEVWVEKDALRNVVEPVTNNFQINLFIPGGRVSTTMIYKASERFSIQQQKGKKCILLYLGDHDPCGLDMILRDIPKRLINLKNDIKIIPIALTKNQIQKYNLPTDQLTKKKDKNKNWYSSLANTDKCWELDALKPKVIQEITEKFILEFLDMEKYNLVVKQEKKDIEKIETGLGKQ